MAYLYGPAWDAEYLGNYRPIVRANLAQNIRILLEYGYANGDIEEDQVPDLLTVLSATDELEGAGQALARLWTHPGLQRVWGTRSKLYVSDNLAHYMAHLDRILAQDYVPTPEDVLKAREMTHGIKEMELRLQDGTVFRAFDVAGQRNQRKNWLTTYVNAAAVMYVAAISEYDQVCLEDSQTNRLYEALATFSEIAAHPDLRKSHFILMLNKDDLFREKLRRVPFRIPGVRFDDFTGPHAVDSGVDFDAAVKAAHGYLLKLFLDKAGPAKGKVFVHFTQATDPQQFRFVFDACKIAVLSDSLVQLGMSF